MQTLVGRVWWGAGEEEAASTGRALGDWERERESRNGT